jgi:hypothetical protein
MTSQPPRLPTIIVFYSYASLLPLSLEIKISTTKTIFFFVLFTSLAEKNSKKNKN